MAKGASQLKRRINIELTEASIGKLDALAHKVNSSRTELIRVLIDESLAQKEKQEMERALEEGYTANYAFIQESSEEWDSTLGDGM